MNPVAEHRPHDLLWSVDDAALLAAGERPAWATADWLAVAPAVVRRAPRGDDGRVPVGLRGRTRSERCAAHVAASGVARRLTPEAIARQAAANADLGGSPLACLRTLAALAPALDQSPLAWGVAGSVGFTLASGLAVLRADSDLDLLLRAPRRADATALRDLAGLLARTEARVDVQVETPVGAFALAEWLRSGGPVLLKTDRGPFLSADPWQLPAAAGESMMAA